MTDIQPVDGNVAAVEPPKPATLTFSLPDVITVDMWNAFCVGHQKYIAAHVDYNQMIADYAGSLEVIRRGFVHYETTSDKARTWLAADDYALTPLSFVSFVRRQIADRINAAVNSPLDL